MKVPGRRWHKAILAAAFAAASIASAVVLVAREWSSARPASAVQALSGGTVEPREGGTEGAEARQGLAETHQATADPVTVVAAGDIACDPANPSFNDGKGRGDECRARAVARLIRGIGPQAVLTLGDHQYDDGRYPKFRRSYDLSYGAFKAITYPAVGNHEYYSSPRARGYFEYFGAQAGDRGKGWYSVDLGAWHVVALNANCSIIGCGRGTAQYEWLRNDLANDASACTLAFWHVPRFSSGPHGPSLSVTPFWRLLRRDDADLVLNAHDHIYERFRPQDASGTRDAFGIREFVVGTGGAERYWIDSVQRNSRVRSSRAFGVLRLTLKDGSYDWRFAPALDARFRDAGTADCV